MARLAGMTRRERWSTWTREPFIERQPRAHLGVAARHGGECPIDDPSDDGAAPHHRHGGGPAPLPADGTRLAGVRGPRRAHGGRRTRPRGEHGHRVRPAARRRRPRARARDRADVCPAAFVAGAFVADGPGAPFDLDAYLRSAAEIAGAAARRSSSRRTASTGSTTRRWVDALGRSGAGRPVHRLRARRDVRPLRPHRRSTPTAACSTSRRASAPSTRRSVAGAEWERLAVRDEVRPDFLVLTGNDLAIDMVM